MILLPPLKVRLAKEDHDTYGDAWYVYDEAKIIRLPVGDLQEIERAIGMSIPTMFARHREGYIDGVLGQIWVARRMSGIIEPFDDFTPLALCVEWEAAGVGDADPPDLTSSSPADPLKKSSRTTGRSSRS